MYQHPEALRINADHLQNEALREADARRLARQARVEAHETRVDPNPFQRRLVALAVALVTILGVVAVLI